MMYTAYIANSFNLYRRNKLLFLAFFSFTGVLLGIVTSHDSGSFIYHLMRRVLSDSVSIVGLTVVTCFPLLITLIILLLSKPYLFYLHCLLKCFSYAFVRCSISGAFVRSGWLVCSILLFSDTIVIFLLHWLWAKHIHCIRKSAKSDLLICFIISLAASLIDYIWVSGLLRPV